MKDINLIAISGRIGSGKDTVANMIQYICDRNSRGKGVLFEEYSDVMLGPNIYQQSEWKIKKFAGKLKQIASILTGIPVEKFEDQEFKKSLLGSEWAVKKQCVLNAIDPFSEVDFYDFMSIRNFLQFLGTDGLRDNLHENVWVNALFADYIKSGYSINVRLLQNLKVDGEDIYPIDFYEKFLKSGISWVDFSEEHNVATEAVKIIEGSKWIISDTRFENELQAVKDRGGLTIRLTRNSDVESSHISETALDDAEFDYVIDNEGKSLEETFSDVEKMIYEIGIK